MENKNSNSIFIQNTNNKHNFKQKQLNYIFITISFAYFLVLNFAFDKLFSSSEEAKLKYAKNTIEKNYTFLRPFQVLLKRIKNYAIGFSTFLFFLGFVMFLYFKYKLTDQRNKTIYGSQKGSIQEHIDSIYKKLNYKPNLSDNLFNSWVMIFLISVTIVFVISNLFVYLMRYAFTITSITGTFLLVLNILIILIGIGFLYSFAKQSDTFNNVTKSTKLIIFIKLIESTILYIPCLLNDLILKYTNTKNNTNDYVFKILLIELFLLFTTFIVPFIDKYISNNLGNTLVDKPIYLDTMSNYEVKKKYKLDSNNNIIIKSREEILKDNSSEIYGISGEKFYTKKYNKDINSYETQYVSYKKYDQNFSVAYWVYFDPIETSSGSSRTYQTILNVSNNPHILYNSSSNKMKFSIAQKYSDQKNGEIIITNIPQQKWLHFVVNYTNGTMDVFMNGELIETKNKVMLNYNENERGPDNIVVGQSPGLKGRITSVSYFNNPLSKSEINTLYVFKKSQTPPTPGGFFLNTRLVYNHLVSGKKSQSGGGVTLDENNPAVYIYGKLSYAITYFTKPLFKYLNDPELAFNDTKTFLINLPDNTSKFIKSNIDYIVFDFDDTVDASGIKIKEYSPEYLADLKSRRVDISDIDFSKYQICGDRSLAKIWLNDPDQNIESVESQKKKMYFEVGDGMVPPHLINYRTKDYSGEKCFTEFDNINEKEYCENNDGIYSEMEAKCFGITKQKCGYEIYKKVGNGNNYVLNDKGVPDICSCDVTPPSGGWSTGAGGPKEPKAGNNCERGGEAKGTYIDIYDPRNDTGTDSTNRTPYCINLYKEYRPNFSEDN